MRNAIKASRPFAIGFILLLMGCVAHASQDTRAPTPGEGYAISQSELPKIKEQALHGDKNAINRMADYSMLYLGDESQGIFWLERLGDTGDIDARQSVLTYYRKHASPENTKHLNLMKARWGR